MKTYLSYLFPATIFYIICSICYGLLSLSDLTQPIDDWWATLGSLGGVLEVTGYITLTIIVAWVAHIQCWRHTMRWIVQMTSRRGLRFGQIPVHDLSLLVGCMILLLAAARYAPSVMTNAWYLLGPLALALIIALITVTPAALDDIIDAPITSDAYATKHRIDEQLLLRENNLDPATQSQFGFGQEIKLP